jgi:hypothetical protein
LSPGLSGLAVYSDDFLFLVSVVFVSDFFFVMEHGLLLQKHTYLKFRAVVLPGIVISCLYTLSSHKLHV